MLRLVRDYRAGVLTGWPDAFTGAAVDAVHLLLEHTDAAEAAVMRSLP